MATAAQINSRCALYFVLPFGESLNYREHKVCSKDLTAKYHPLRQRYKLFDAVVTPTVLYGCGSWTMNAARGRMLTKTQRSMARLILGKRRKIMTEEWSMAISQMVRKIIFRKQSLESRTWIGSSVSRESPTRRWTPSRSQSGSANSGGGSGCGRAIVQGDQTIVGQRKYYNGRRTASVTARDR